MSLLNEALRKRRGEQRQIGGTPAVNLPTPGAKDRVSKGRFWIAIGSVALLTAAAFGIWVYRSTSSSPSLLVDASPTALDAKRPGHHPSIVTESQAAPVALTTSMPAPQVPKDPSPEPATATSESPAAKAKATQPPKTAKQVRPRPKAPDKIQTAYHPATRKTTIPDGPKTPEHSHDVSRRVSKSGPANMGRHLQADGLYEKACQYHRRDRLEQAIALYREVIKIDPEHPDARFNLGAAYLQTKAFTKAYYILADLYRKEPENQQVMLNLAMAEMGCHRFDDALALLDKTAETPEPPLFEIALHKGIVYNHLKRPQDALKWYRRAEALRPDDPRLMFNLAVASDQQQRYTAAINYYRRYLDLSSEMDPAKEKQVRRRIRVLRAYGAQLNPKESMPQ
jgi:Flp pilus assembly protein TadD